VSYSERCDATDNHYYAAQYHWHNLGSVVEVAFQDCQPPAIAGVIRTERDNKAIYGHRQGVVMKKSLIIIVLSLLQGACAATGSATEDAQSMLTFKQIAGEISVQHEVLEADTDLSQTAARVEVAAL
jgi:hypothetical protein